VKIGGAPSLNGGSAHVEKLISCRHVAKRRLMKILLWQPAAQRLKALKMSQPQ
jgi:hypothetical protein